LKRSFGPELLDSHEKLQLNPTPRNPGSIGNDRDAVDSINPLSSKYYPTDLTQREENYSSSSDIATPRAAEKSP
jgi:hypothetical protein